MSKRKPVMDKHKRKVLDLLELCGELCPNQRVCQIIGNTIPPDKINHENGDTYYITDEELAGWLQDYADLLLSGGEKLMKKVGNKWVAWFKFLNGVVGIAATVGWFIFMVGSPVVVTLGGVPVVGSLIFSCILIGNAYGMWCVAKEGHATLMEHKAIKRRIDSMHEAWETTTKWNENDESSVSKGIKWPRK